MNAQRFNQRALEKIGAIFSRREEGLSKEEREVRLQGLERIAISVRARRSKSEGPQSTPASPRKGRIRA
jgi:hypothetical protein